MKEEIKVEIESLNRTIHQLKDEVEMCKEIEVRSTKIEKKLNLIEDEFSQKNNKQIVMENNLTLR